MIWTIFRKELKDTLRDRRTVMMMIVIPTLIFPLVMNIFVSISASFNKEAAEKNVKIGLYSDRTSRLEEELFMLPKALGKREFVPMTDTLEMMEAIRNDS